MNKSLFFAALILLVSGSFTTATASIAVKCFNDNEGYKENNKRNFDYVALNVAIGVITILVGIFTMYRAFKDGSSDE